MWGSKFTLRTDHKPLVNILSTGGGWNSTARIARLASKLQEYNFKTEYLPGKKNVTADFLSRLPCDQDKINASKECDFVVTINDIVSNQFEGITEDKWNDCVQLDDRWCELKKCVSDGWPKRNMITSDLLPFFYVSEELEFEGNLLFKAGKCVSPRGMQDIILNLAHKTHPGISSMKRLVRSFFWWPGMDKFINRVVRECQECVSSERMLKLHVPPLKVVKRPEVPWQKLAFDISGPFNELPEHSRFALVMIYYHSK